MARERQRACLGLALLLGACDPSCVVAGDSLETIAPDNAGECIRVRAEGDGLGVVSGAGDECAEWSACLVALPGESIRFVREHEIPILNDTSGGWAIDRDELGDDGTCPLVCR